MASFKDPKRRMAILIADLYYESEQHQKALSIYQSLENRRLGTLSKNERAYVVLCMFACHGWDFKKNEIDYMETHLNYNNICINIRLYYSGAKFWDFQKPKLSY
jgi:hypothetical protein